jgi:hypothetical protein
MKRKFRILCVMLFVAATFYSCEQSQDETALSTSVPDDVLAKLKDLGFNVTNHAPQRFEEGYLVEGDIYLTNKDILEMKASVRVPQVEQYSTNNLVKATTPRNIAVFIPNTSFSPTYIAALDEAISRYNAENLNLTFTRVDASYPRPTIVFRKLAASDENMGVLGAAGFPTSYGNPYGQIKMSSILETAYGLDVNGIATIMAHEIGHCIGFRHTDFFDRSISCGGWPYDEGDGGVGANHVPGTPTGATYEDLSWMLSCTDGGDRPFNSDDKTALSYLY